MRIRILQVLLGLMMMAPMVARAADGDKVIDVLVLKMADEIGRASCRERV